MALKQRVSARDYLAMPEEPPYLEYVYGEVVPKAMPNVTHGQLVMRLGFDLELYRRRSGGTVGTEVRSSFEEGASTGYRLPDLSYWAPSKPIGGATMALPPTLAVEVRSPGESLRDQREKCRYFRRHGVEVAWLIDPDRKVVEVFEGSSDGVSLQSGASLASEHLPGLEIAVGPLFEAS